MEGRGEKQTVRGKLGQGRGVGQTRVSRAEWAASVALLQATDALVRPSPVTWGGPFPYTPWGPGVPCWAPHELSLYLLSPSRFLCSAGT